jgi:alpha-L-fucosidase
MSSDPSMLYQPNWESLTRYCVPDWFKEAKLGIFIHWGVYAVPAFGDEWYPRWMYKKDRPEFEHHRSTWGAQSKFGYKDFIPLFKAENWDPEAWLDLFIEAGARYVVPVAEHHDGFAMYRSNFTPWNAASMGPKRDVIEELWQAVLKRGLRFGVSSHRAYNWRYYTFEDDFDTMDPKNAEFYGEQHVEEDPASQEFIDNWLGRCIELVDKFQPDVYWFDFGWHWDEFAPYRPEITAYYYNKALEWGKEVVLNYKRKFPDGVAVYDVERGKLDDIREEYWQTDTSVSTKSWGYLENDDFKSVTTIVHDLVDIVSKNGNLLLNVGPRPDGTIPEEVQSILRGLGNWLKVNGEAIYGTTHWVVFGEGPTRVEVGHISEHKNAPFTQQDIRFTRKENSLYAIALGWPEGEFLIKSLGSTSSIKSEQIERISLLGQECTLSWRQDEKGLEIEMPGNRLGEHAWCFRIQLKA